MRKICCISVIAFLLISTGCTASQITATPKSNVFLPHVEMQARNIAIPKQSDWIDHGEIIKAGAPGMWDRYLWGGFAFSVIKKGNTYFLYYQGASDYRTEFDETVLWRAIGVATSTDGINYTKYKENPILRWSPKQNGEEGAVSSGVTIGPAGEIVLFYGANTEESRTTVNADIRVASSQDGFKFKDLGKVLDHKNRSVWGSGDELFAIDAIYDNGKWIVYYIPNGTNESGKLGVATGSQSTSLPTTSAVKSGSAFVSTWGTAGHIKLGGDNFALVINNLRDKKTEVRFSTVQSPQQVSLPVQTYQFEGVFQSNLLLDQERNTWFLYYATESGYGLKLAPAGAPDTSPPSIPADLKSGANDSRRIEISWQAAEDRDTGIAQYIVYRDGKVIGQTKNNRYIDNCGNCVASYQYQVAAVNFHGIEGRKSAPILVNMQGKKP